ncbi:hypothetical protein AA0115_g4017 [Alternaria tenuissima]|uniref:Uncharacterized protein n=1 Tax=Alternaria tenuissima TaxID=119927 RepID=A0AB37WMP4_9PLEO|nr:hypothetical protein AA0115_g4017 [Alternaria tenuissima]
MFTTSGSTTLSCSNLFSKLLSLPVTHIGVPREDDQNTHGDGNQSCK